MSSRSLCFPPARTHFCTDAARPERRRLVADEVRLERHHPRDREQQRRVVRDQARRGRRPCGHARAKKSRNAARSSSAVRGGTTSGYRPASRVSRRSPRRPSGPRAPRAGTSSPSTSSRVATFGERRRRHAGARMRDADASATATAVAFAAGGPLRASTAIPEAEARREPERSASCRSPPVVGARRRSAWGTLHGEERREARRSARRAPAHQRRDPHHWPGDRLEREPRAGGSGTPAVPGGEAGPRPRPAPRRGSASSARPTSSCELAVERVHESLDSSRTRPGAYERDPRAHRGHVRHPGATVANQVVELIATPLTCLRLAVSPRSRLPEPGRFDVVPAPARRVVPPVRDLVGRYSCSTQPPARRAGTGTPRRVRASRRQGNERPGDGRGPSPAGRLAHVGLAAPSAAITEFDFGARARWITAWARLSCASGRPDELHRARRGVGDQQRLRVGQADVLGREDHEAPGDEARRPPRPRASGPASTGRRRDRSRGCS